MRQTIINSLETLVWALMALIMLFALFGGLTTMFTRSFFMGLAFLVGGALYAIVLGGMIFIFIGIHDNTRRTAEAVERMAKS